MYKKSIITDTLITSAEEPNNIQIIHDLYLPISENADSLLDSHSERVKTLVKQSKNSLNYDYLIIMNDLIQEFQLINSITSR